MDRNSAINYITSVDWRKSRLGLERISELMYRLGNPQHGLKFVHVAGTNGKGSTSAMLAGVLCAAGYTTGLYTSPYINRFNERMQVDGQPIDDEALVEITARVRAAADGMADHPTEFELVTAVAFEWFRRCGCDIVVLEVGLGGRLDATNVIEAPELAVITTIALDHTEQLGDTLEQIAAEKAGIIKRRGAVVVYPQPPGVMAVLKAVCVERGARLCEAKHTALRHQEASLEGQRFAYGSLTGLFMPLLGPHQLCNAATVITAAWVLREKRWCIPDAAIQKGLASVRWPARFELVARSPAVIVDGGHNPQCAMAFKIAFDQYFNKKKMLLVAGVMADKDYAATFRIILPQVAQVFCVAPKSPRALPAKALAAFFHAEGLAEAHAFADVQSGLRAALAAAQANDVVCAFGSLYMAGEIRGFFL